MTNESKGTVLARRVEVASSLWARSWGLLGKTSLASEEGMWLKPCRGIHTFFMRFPIDTLFLDSQGVVLHGATVPPWRMSRVVLNAAGVVELPAGTLERTQTLAGDRIKVDPI